MSGWTFLFYLVVVTAYEKSTVSRCLWHNNSCVDFCPEGLVVTKSDCNQTYWVAQKTCDQPEDMLVGTVCGFSRCDCPKPMVLDKDTGYCYEVDNCPTKHVADKK